MISVSPRRACAGRPSVPLRLERATRSSNDSFVVASWTRPSSSSLVGTLASFTSRFSFITSSRRGVREKCSARGGVIPPFGRSRSLERLVVEMVFAMARVLVSTLRRLRPDARAKERARSSSICTTRSHTSRSFLFRSPIPVPSLIEETQPRGSLSAARRRDRQRVSLASNARIIHSAPSLRLNPFKHAILLFDTFRTSNVDDNSPNPSKFSNALLAKLSLRNFFRRPNPRVVVTRFDDASNSSNPSTSPTPHTPRSLSHTRAPSAFADSQTSPIPRCVPARQRRPVRRQLAHVVARHSSPSRALSDHRSKIDRRRIIIIIIIYTLFSLFAPSLVSRASSSESRLALHHHRRLRARSSHRHRHPSRPSRRVRLEPVCVNESRIESRSIDRSLAFDRFVLVLGLVCGRLVSVVIHLIHRIVSPSSRGVASDFLSSSIDGGCVRSVSDRTEYTYIHTRSHIESSVIQTVFGSKRMYV